MMLLALAGSANSLLWRAQNQDSTKGLMCPTIGAPPGTIWAGWPCTIQRSTPPCTQWSAETGRAKKRSSVSSSGSTSRSAHYSTPKRSDVTANLPRHSSCQEMSAVCHETSTLVLRVRMKREAIRRRRSPAARRPRAAVAGDAHGHARHRDRRERAPPLRPRRAALAVERSVLVPGARLGDGHGLALLGHHHVGDGRAEEGAQPARRTSSASTSAAAAAGSRATRRRSCATIADRTSLDGEALVRTSRLTARIDNNAIADGFQIYLHSFVLTADGEWAIVQQGMNEASRLARRYHWHSAAVRDFTADPHTAIVGEHAGTIRNLVDRRARPAQDALLTIARDDPATTLAEVRRLEMPAHHDVRAADVNEKRLGAVLALAHERDLRDFASFLLLEQLGPRTLQSLALIAEVVHGTPTRFDDPARFSFAHGGKDGHPFPVPLKVYDESIAVLRRALDAAKLGHSDKLHGFVAARRLRARDRAASRPRSRRRRRRSPTSARSPRRSAAARCSTTARARSHVQPRRGQLDLFND